MRRQLIPAVIAVGLFTAMTLLYSVVTNGVGLLLFNDKANGSLVEDAAGNVVGSSLIGQTFVEPQYFHPRPSASAYTPGPSYSYGSNDGPNRASFLYGEDDPETPDVDESQTNGVDDRVRAYREENGLSSDASVPVDAVTASGSGLDPHISVRNAQLQAARVAKARDISVDVVLQLVARNTDGRAFGVLGEPGVNVLELNLALDAEG